MIDLLNINIYGDVTLYNFLFAVLVTFIAVLLARIITRNLRRVLTDKLKKDQLELLLKSIYFGILLIAFLSISPLLGINLSGLLVAGGILGIIIGFASQSVVSNLVSGIFLLAEKPVKIGDQIEVEGVRGIVEDVNILSTIIRTYDGLYVRVPNDKLFASNIVNFSANVARRFEYVVGISYRSDINKAIELIKKVIEDHPFVLKNPEPLIFVDELGESSVNVSIRAWTPTSEWFNVRIELLQKIKESFDENGIEIPFPQRVIWFGEDEKES